MSGFGNLIVAFSLAIGIGLPILVTFLVMGVENPVFFAGVFSALLAGVFVAASRLRAD